MKNIALTLTLFIILFNACAQDKGKITIRITDETSGEKRTIEKSFDSREEMYTDKELREFGLYPFDIVVLNDSIQVDLPISQEEIEELTEMAARVSEEARVVVSNIDIRKEDIKAHVEEIRERLNHFELSEGDHFCRSKPD